MWHYSGKICAMLSLLKVITGDAIFYKILTSNMIKISSISGPRIA